MSTFFKIKLSRNKGAIPTLSFFDGQSFVYNERDGILYGRMVRDDGSFAVVPIGRVSSVVPGNGVTDVYVEQSPDMPVDILKVIKDGTVQQVTTIPRPTGVLWGGLITWTGSGYTYSLNPTGWNIRGLFFSITEPVLLTLADAHETHDRFDVFALNDQGQAIVIPGTPAENPQVPALLPESQLFITSLLVKANSTVPDVPLSIVFDEGSENEWAPTYTGVTADFESSVNPAHGSVHANISDIVNGNSIFFTAPIPFSLSGITNINWFLLLKENMTADHNLYISLYSQGNPVTQEHLLLLNKNYVSRYQQVVVPMADFRYTASVLAIDGIRLRWSKTGLNETHRGFLLDYLKMEGGITPPSVASDHNSLDGLQGGAPEERYHLTEGKHNTIQKITEAENLPIWNGNAWPETDLAAKIHAATAKTTPVDADELALRDSVSTELRKVSWANIKAKVSDNDFIAESENPVQSKVIQAALSGIDQSKWEVITGQVTKTGYGALYNWFAVDEAPANGGFIDGFTVPTDAQWTELADHLGGESVAGDKLKSTRTGQTIEPRWDSQNTGATDKVNFSALPGNFRFSNGAFPNSGYFGYWWSATEHYPTHAWYRNLAFNNNAFSRLSNNKDMGVSVRCFRDLIGNETSLPDGTFLQSVQDADGNWYEVVKIGTQAWVAQNLRTTKYADGTPIPNVTDNTEWSNLETGAYCWYNNDINTAGIVYTDEDIDVITGLKPKDKSLKVDAEWIANLPEGVTIDSEFIIGSTNPVESQVIQKTLTIVSPTPPNVADFRLGTKWINQTTGDEFTLYYTGTHRVWMQTSARNQTVYNQLETLIIADDIIENYTLQDTDNKLLPFNLATEIEFQIPLDSEFRTGSQCIAWQKGDGQIKVVAETGVTLRYPRTDIYSRTKDSLITIIKVADNDYILSGDIA